jgi:hypothetical protein
MIFALRLMYQNKEAYLHPFTQADTQANNSAQPVPQSPQEKISGHAEDLASFSVKPGDHVSGILNFTGSVKGGYFFEGNIGVNVLDTDKKLLKAGHGMSSTDWMTSATVSFYGSIDLTGLPKGSAYIEIANDNPSGLSQNDKSIYIPVVIQ